MLDHPLHKEFFPNDQFTPPLVQFETFFTLNTHPMRKETSTVLTATSFQEQEILPSASSPD